MVSTKQVLTGRHGPVSISRRKEATAVVELAVQGLGRDFFPL